MESRTATYKIQYLQKGSGKWVTLKGLNYQENVYETIEAAMSRVEQFESTGYKGRVKVIEGGRQVYPVA